MDDTRTPQPNAAGNGGASETRVGRHMAPETPHAGDGTDTPVVQSSLSAPPDSAEAPDDVPSLRPSDMPVRARATMRPDKQPFVRQPAPRRTQPPVDYLTEDEEDAAVDYSHESSYTGKAVSPLSGRDYRRSRQTEDSFKKGLRYGQYLEVPKGSRNLFTSRRQAQTRRNALAIGLAILFIIIAMALFFIFII